MGGLGFGTDERMLLPPLDLMIMAAVARDQGCKVRIMDADAGRMTPNETAAALKEFGPEAIVATVSLPTIDHDCDWIGNLAVLVGRPVFVKTFVREPAVVEEILKKSRATRVIVGEPDFSLLDILEGRSVEGTARLNPAGVVILEPYRPIESLDALPFAARDLLPHKPYCYPLLGSDVTTFQTSRGCPYPCGYYCPYPMVEGKTWRPMTPRRIVDEMKSVEALSIRKILFRDATFTLQRDRIMELCDRMTGERLQSEWWCETRADLLDPELLDRMAGAGCRGINVGVESGNEDMIQTIGKRGLTIEKLSESRRAAARAGIRMHFLMQVGLPGETRSTMVDTLDLLWNLRPDTIGLTFTTPYPGTDLYRDALRRGWLTSRRWEDFDAHTAILRTETLTTDELVLGRKMLEQGFRMIHDDAPPGQRRIFYIETLRWAYGLESANAKRLQGMVSPPLWKKILRPAWRSLPISWRERIRRSAAGLFRRTA